MNPQTLFRIIILIVTLQFLWDLLVDYLNYRRFDAPVPSLLKDLYDEETYRKSVEYKKANYRFALIKSTFSFIVLLLVLFLKILPRIDQLAAEMTHNPVGISLIFFGIIYTIGFIIDIPFDWYHTFVIEEKFGFNKQTPKLFILDKIKSFLLTLVIGGILLGIIIALYRHYSSKFVWSAWLVIAVFSVLINMFYSDVIVPLFNKQTPLEAGELRQRLEDLAVKAGFTLKDIYVIDGSKRSTKANAYFSGLGPRKRIVLFDTLIQDLSPGEISAVLAHEIGHYKHKHILINLILSLASTGLMLWLFSLLLQSDLPAKALGFDKNSFHAAAIVFALLYTPVSALLGFLMNTLSRQFEYQADAYAVRFGLGRELTEGLKKLSKKSLANLTPHPLYTAWHYSHPTLLQRIRKIMQYEK